MSNIWFNRLNFLTNRYKKVELARILLVSKQRLNYWFKVKNIPKITQSQKTKIAYRLYKEFKKKKVGISFSLYLKSLSRSHLRSFIIELKVRLSLFFRKTFFTSLTELTFCESGEVRRISFSNFAVDDNLKLYKEDIIDRLGKFDLVDKCPEKRDSTVAKWTHVIDFIVR